MSYPSTKNGFKKCHLRDVTISHNKIDEKITWQREGASFVSQIRTMYIRIHLSVNIGPDWNGSAGSEYKRGRGFGSRQVKIAFSFSSYQYNMFPGSDPDSIKFVYGKLTETGTLGVHLVADKQLKKHYGTVSMQCISISARRWSNKM